jgi:hypothetical protein
VQVPSSALTINSDGSINLHLVDVPVNDAFTFPPPAQAVPGISPVQLIPAKLSLDITYLKGGNPRHVRPRSHDPLSPLNWAGMMEDSTNSGTFSLSYDDGSFSASGSFASNGNFGEMGFERNGVFTHEEGDGTEDVQADAHADAAPANTMQTGPLATPPAKQQVKFVLLKNRVPIRVAD